MELLIRSQDKKNLCLIRGAINVEVIDEIYDEEDDCVEAKITYIENGMQYVLGVYKNKQRALEVLDAICEHQEQLNRISFIQFKSDYLLKSITNKTIFQMPLL